MGSELALVGILFILAGFALVFFSASGGSTQSGGVIFLGPVPIAFGNLNNPETTKWLWVIGIALFLAIILFGSKLLG